MINVHPDFRPLIKDAYPDGNNPIFEEWFYEYGIHAQTERVYLPIFWTSYYVNHRYGKDVQAMNMLQRLIDGLDQRKKYYTVLQYDDGILNDVSRIDLKVFGAGGGHFDYPLPLLCQPKQKIETEKTILGSFRGNINNPIRKDLKRILDKSKFIYTDERVSPEDYQQELAKSIFAFCPRGYGWTSFRIMEAMNQGAIPVYISDKFIIPHNSDFEEYGLLIDSSEIGMINAILDGVDIKEKQAKLKDAYERLYTFEATKDLILQNAN
jgi:hypothetical protein